MSGMRTPAGAAHYRLGRLEFAVEGQDTILPHVAEELAPLRRTGAGGPALRFRFGRLDPVREGVEAWPLRVGAEGYEARLAPIGLAYAWRPDRQLVRADIQVHSLGLPTTWRGRLAPMALRRARHWNYLAPDEDVAKNFMYGVFDHLTQVAGLARGQSYIHASSFERGGEGVALFAWGGVGKTTALLKLVLENGWHFLSDDLGLLDREGTLWRTPKRLQVYAYNTAGQPGMRRALLGKRSWLDRASFAWMERRRGPHGVRRRVSAESLFGAERVASQARLRHALFLERADVDRFRWQTLPVEALAERAASILLHELQPVVELAAALGSAGAVHLLPRPEELYRRSAAVLSEGLRATAPLLLRIPRRAGPDALADTLREHLEG
jgi:hypothetical protein